MKKNNRNGDFSRPKSSAIEIAGTILLLCALLITVGSGMAFDLPRVIGEIHLDHYAQDFACIGDQNGDGKGDLIVFEYPDTFYSIYWGSNQFSARANLIIPRVPREMDAGYNMVYIERFTREKAHTFITHDKIEGDIGYLNFYSNVSEQRHDPYFIYSHADSVNDDNTLVMWPGHTRKPMDFNGDGFDDIFYAHNITEGTGRLEIKYGGREIDMIPDWTKYYPERVNDPISLGQDVNADGFDDFLYEDQTPERFHVFSLFLGGAEPDTMPVLTFVDTSFHIEGGTVLMDDGFSLLQDVNDDGYDDFGIYVKYQYPDNIYDSRIYLFWGGEEIDAEPDLILEGHRGIVGDYGNIVGGDFNGDGIGDIAVSFWGPNPYSWGEVQIHLGNRWIDETADIYIPETAYGGRYDFIGFMIGAVGDYDGDGVHDLVCVSIGEANLVVFAGNREWQLNVDEAELPTKIDFSLRVSPNPFNLTTKIDYRIGHTGHYKITGFDLYGKEVSQLFSGSRNVGEFTIDWSAPVAGIYFIKLSEVNYGGVIIKTICLP